METVSIIMPAYNAESFIVSSINSVLAQTYEDWKLYVIDDASIDNTGSLVLSFNDSRVCYIRQVNNQGVSIARNVGISAAQGRYIAFLDSDDLWAENKLKIQLDILENGYDVVCSNYTTFSHSSDFTISLRTFPSEFTFTDMLTGNKIGNLTGVYNQERIGKVFQRKVGHEDYIMWLDVMSRTSKCFCVQDSLAYYRVSDKSLSGNKIKASLWQWEVYRKHLGFGMIKSAYYWHCYVLNALVR
ncbi:glycosyl transferase [Aeromonas salmonicida]|nr:glycosyl transferase [Aeromonas salmonicida]